MPAPFHRLSLPEFALLLTRYPFERRINAVHMHHTWRPRRRDWRGAATVAGMDRYHREVNGWSDIAQHVTLDPEGFIWTGRSFDQPPASAAGHNGNRQAGPFMFEMVGDFDAGREPFDGPQRETAIAVVALVQQRFGLSAETLRFHNEMSAKSCPGTGIGRATVLADVRRLVKAGLPAPATGPASLARVEAAIQTLRGGARGAGDTAEAEPVEDDLMVLGAPRSRGPRLTPAELDELRPHVINLSGGYFSDDGAFASSEGQVRSIFEEHLPRAVEKAIGGRLRVVLYAHGGLVNEGSGLAGALDHVRHWKKQGAIVYPLYFVWETGPIETLVDILRGIGEKEAARGIGDVTDRLIERLVKVPGGRLWDEMKASAARASAPDGGAHVVARHLGAFCGRYRDHVELHAIGHSAGAIFHSHFLPAALAAGAPGFRSLQLLAPAVRTDVFGARLRPLMGQGVDRTFVYTMRHAYEQADTCAGLYRKSLLYLIHYALEDERETPILGLEDSLRDDAELRAAFGLDGQPNPAGGVVWSVTEPEGTRLASTALRHGDFDQNGPTMDSAVRVVLGRSEVVPYARPQDPRARAAWDDGAPPPPVPVPPGASGDGQQGAVVLADPAGSAGTRRALCIGVDQYAGGNQLRGCVNDARLWARTLGTDLPEGRRFDVRMLLDAAATKDAILGAMTELVEATLPGDVGVIHFSGHGTRVPDLDGDEAGGDTPGSDEALCPYGFEDGDLIVDDEIAAVFARIKDGANVTCFFDCCHAGTGTRFAVSGATPPPRGTPRYVTLSDDTVAAFRRKQQHRAAGRGAPTGSPGAGHMREVLFAACRSREEAMELNDQGVFTRHATALIAEADGRLAHDAFETRVLQAFDPAGRQFPQLDCAPARRTDVLFGPSVRVAAGANGYAPALAGAAS